MPQIIQALGVNLVKIVAPIKRHLDLSLEPIQRHFRVFIHESEVLRDFVHSIVFLLGFVREREIHMVYLRHGSQLWEHFSPGFHQLILFDHRVKHLVVDVVVSDVFSKLLIVQFLFQVFDV